MTVSEKIYEFVREHFDIGDDPDYTPDVHLFDELGSIEAAWFFKVHELGPFVVDIDCEGNNFFDRLDGEIEERKKNALNDLGIDPSFVFTKLY